MQDGRISRLVTRRVAAVQERDALRAQAREIIAEAEEAGHENLDHDQDAAFRSLTERIKNADAQVSEFDARIAELAPEPEQFETEGARFLRGLASGDRPGARLPLPADLDEQQIRRLFDAAKAGEPTRVEARIGGIGETTLVTPMLVGGNYKDMPRVASLFGTQDAPSPTVRIYRTSTPATAGVVAEAAAKPASGLAVTPVDLSMKKIATTTTLTEELLFDFPTFAQLVQRELSRAVIAQENATLVADLQAVSGLGSLAVTGDLGIDSTSTAIGNLEALGVTPDGIVLSPGRLADIRKSVASTSGVYIVDPQSRGPAALHGLPVTVAPQLDDTTILVGAFRDAGRVYLREALSVRLGWNADDFSKNQRTMVCEERLVLGVTQPSRIVAVDVT